jgi:hypothetical protein
MYNVLAHTLEDQSYDIHGLLLPNNESIFNMSFADHSTLYMLGTSKILDKVK